MYFDADAVDRLLPYEQLTEALRKSLSRGTTVPLRASYAIEPSGATLLSMPAWTDELIGAKLLTIFPHNSTVGLPGVQGTYTLFDGKSGAPRAIVNGTQLTLRRTAALCALATGYLARPTAERLLVVGTGALASHIVRAHVATRDWSAIAIWGRSPERTRQVIAELAASGYDVKAVDDLEQAASEACVVSTATSSARPLIMSDWIQAGTHINLMGAFTAQMQEADERLVARSKLFVDDRSGVLAEGGDVIVPIRNGLMTDDAILGDVHDLIASGHRIRSADEITIFKSVGWGALDLVAAAFLAEHASAAS